MTIMKLYHDKKERAKLSHWFVVDAEVKYHNYHEASHHFWNAIIVTIL